MAGPVARETALSVMEDAVRLLRDAPLLTWVCHWTGSAPFALLALWFWNDLTNPRTLDSTGAVESLGLAILLVWMNCWRSVFAGRLRRQLGGSDSSWTTRRVAKLVANQSFYGATRLVIMPLAWLSVFPLAASIAFYRNIAVFAGRDDLDAGQLLSKARKLAGIQSGQSWALLAPLTLLYLLVTVNLGIVLALLPQVVRMLTGYESAFSRSGAYFALNPLFFLSVFALSWIAFDPFVQAVYCVRCFRGESLETGEDLRSALRRLTVAALLVFLPALTGPMGATQRRVANPPQDNILPHSAAEPQHLYYLLLPALLLPASSLAAVKPPDLEKSVQQAMQSHEYDWRLPPAAGGPSKDSWIVRLADHMVAGMKAVAKFVGRAIEKILEWIFPKRLILPGNGSPPAAGLHWSLYVIAGLVVLAALYLFWKKRGKRQAAAPADLDAPLIHLEAEDLSPDRLPEERWIELANQCLRDGNYRLALRALYLANLAWLGRREFLTIHPGKTNREYELELRRRTRAVPESRALFARNIAAFERVWYGLHEVGPADVEAFRSRIGEMKTLLPENTEMAA